MNISTRRLAYSALVAAVYAALTVALAPISFGPVQFRISEVLCILPFFFPYTSVGLFVGCILANLIGGFGIADIVIGSLATLIAALAVASLGKSCKKGIGIKLIACLLPAVANGLLVGAMLAVVASTQSFIVAFPVFAAQVFFGEVIVLFVLGLPLMHFLPKTRIFAELNKK